MLDSFVGKLNIVGAALAGAFAAQKAGGGIMSMISSASDLQENMGKVEAIFGSSSKLIVAASNQMAAAFGTSKNEFLGAAGQLGSLFKGAGMSEKAAASLSVQITKLAGDAKSFNNDSFSEAFQKLRAGLTGEAEPLKAYGVLLSEEAVKSQAYAMGIAKVGGELTEMAKIQARVALITQKMGDAQGDQAKNSSKWAGLVEGFWGRLDNLAGTFGKAFLPAAEEGLTVVNQFISAFDGWAQSSGIIELMGSLIQDLIVTPIKCVVGMVKSMDETFKAFGINVVNVFMGVIRVLAGTAHMIAAVIKVAAFGKVDLASTADMAFAKANSLATMKPKVASIMPAVAQAAHGTHDSHAAAFEMGSKEAYSAILGSRAQQQGGIQDRVLASIDQTGKLQLAVLKVIARGTEDRENRGGLATSLATV